jgi:hypothetical protein
MTSLVLHAMRKRPLISLGLAGASGIVTTACTVEYMAECREQEWIKNHHHHDHAPPRSPSDTTLSDAAVQPHLLPRVYDREAIRAYWMERPVTVVSRFGQAFYELAPLAVSYVWDFKIVGPPTKILPPTNQESPSLDAVVDVQALAELQRVHSAKLREALTNLGPAWVKGKTEIAINLDEFSYK